MQRYTFPVINLQLYKWLRLGGVFVFFLYSFKVEGQIISRSDFTMAAPGSVKVGAEHTEQYLSMLQGKNVAVVANQTSLVKKKPLADTLISLGIKVVKIFAPEHGFYGEQDAGDTVKNAKIPQSLIHIISLYGEHKKPSAEDLSGVDVVVYDIQDVGVRFFTYISTLHMVMEACAENNKPLIILDRPDPNGYYVDGPVLESVYKSFSGMDPVPVVYAMTPGEYAQMLNGEKWLSNGVQCNLTCIPVTGYSHKNYYEVPVKPSPNLKSMSSIYLYPTLALFEGTVISVGRGTDKPFEVIGNPLLKNTPYNFTPESMPGAQHPPFEGQKCYGYNLSNFGNIMIRNYQKLYLFWLMGTYKDYPDKANFFNSYFKNLAGNTTLQKQIEQGVPEDEIRKSWLPGISNFLKIRKKYLLYTDFQ